MDSKNINAKKLPFFTPEVTVINVLSNDVISASYGNDSEDNWMDDNFLPNA